MLSPLSTLCFGGKCAESGYLCDSNKTFLIDAAQAKDLEKTAIQIKRTEATWWCSQMSVSGTIYTVKKSEQTPSFFWLKVIIHSPYEKMFIDE